MTRLRRSDGRRDSGCVRGCQRGPRLLWLDHSLCEIHVVTSLSVGCLLRNISCDLTTRKAKLFAVELIQATAARIGLVHKRDLTGKLTDWRGRGIRVNEKGAQTGVACTRKLRRLGKVEERGDIRQCGGSACSCQRPAP